MFAPLPTQLPDQLPAYLPGRIRTIDEGTPWPPHERYETTGVPATLPRYGLELLVRDPAIDPDRVRWLVERTTTRPLAARHAHLTTWRGIVHVVDGRHALAAHLATGGEHIPVRLVRPEA